MNRILIIANHDYALYNFRKEVIMKIVDEGFEVIISSPIGEKVGFFENLGCTCINTKLDRRGLNPIKDFKLLITYLEIIKRFKPDLVLTYTSKCSIYGGMACKFMKTPYIVNNSGLIILPQKLTLLKPFISILYKISDNKCNCMMYQNAFEMKELNRILKHKVRYRLIPGSGVNLQEYAFKEYPDEDSEIIFNYVARIMKGKGIEEYLDCAKIIHKKYPNTRFNIFGFFDDDKYKSIIYDYERQGIIRYMGVYEDLRPFIEQSHAIIHTSYSEGMTNVCLEHSSMGRVCIVSDIPGCQEIVDDKKTGYLFELKNVEDLVEKIEMFINLPLCKKKDMGKLAREKMEKEFDRKQIVDVYLDEINRIIKNN